MWYSKLYRRHLADMHVDDWDERFLSEFSPEDYVDKLKHADVNMAMIYFQSHAGLCYYPTKVGVIHRAFRGREDMMRRTEQLCHEAGIRTVGYYSLIYNTREHDRHPDWRIVDDSGQSRRAKGDNGGAAMAFASAKGARYGLCCPNNPDYRRFVLDQVDEILDYFDPDGLFFDMPFWPISRLCRCKHCQARWAKEMDGQMPPEPSPRDKGYAVYNTKKYEWMGDFIQSITNHIKTRKPELSVEYNGASLTGSSMRGCGEEVMAAMDYCGGDLYGGPLFQSVACKLFYSATRNQPYEYMFSRCKPALRTHTMSKSQDELRTELAITAANHGASMVIDAIDPVGTMDGRVYDELRGAFSFVKPYEPYYRGTLSADVGIYLGVRSGHDVGNDPKSNEVFTSNRCMVGCARTFTEHHIPYAVTGSWSHLNYPYLFAPVLKETETGDTERLIDYVRQGGTLYFSGADNPVLLAELVGGELEGYTAENMIYVAPKKRYERKFHGFNAKYPLFFEKVSTPIVKGVNPKTVVATITLPYTEPDSIAFASIHSDPPGRSTRIPAVVVRSYGKGRVVWSALPMEGMELEDYGEILLSLVFEGKRDFLIRTDAPESVETVVFDAEGEQLIHVVNHNERMHVPDVPPFRISVRCEREPRQIQLLPDETPVKFTWRSGYATFRTKKLHIFDMYRLVF